MAKATISFNEQETDVEGFSKIETSDRGNIIVWYGEPHSYNNDSSHYDMYPNGCVETVTI